MIPRIIHQIWIGPRPMPAKLMQTWKDRHPDWQYILWDEDKIRTFGLVNQKAHDFYLNRQDKRGRLVPSLEGAADVIRVEILAAYGGVYVDADSVCLEPLDDLLDRAFFAVLSPNTQHAPWFDRRVANGVMGCVPDSPLMVEYQRRIGEVEDLYPAYAKIGGGLLSELVDQFNQRANILPAYTFYPTNMAGEKYTGTGKIYSYHNWGQVTKYDTNPDWQLQNI